MDSKELQVQLQQAGWLLGTNPITGDGAVTWYAFRRLVDATECQCNDRPPSICIMPYEFKLNDHWHRSVQIELRGQTKSGVWVDFHTYGISFDKVSEEFPNSERILRAAWEAANQGE